MSGYRGKSNFPDRYHQILDELNVCYKGQVFLIGAGICGKVYCDEVFLQGGIGIDIGAVCDCWLGLATRPR